MIAVSPVFQSLINADSRHFVAKVEVFFDGDGNLPVTFYEDDIVRITFLDEAQADSYNPLGSVSSNEITVVFNNSHRHFIPGNEDSPFFGKVRQRVTIKPFVGLRLPDAPIEYVPLGVYYAASWDAPSTTMEASVVAYDRLYDLMDRDMPMIPVIKDTTVGAMFEILFISLGLTPAEYGIDPSLNQPISRGWFPGGKARNSLQQLAVAGNCNIAVSRSDIIRVMANVVTGEPVITLTDNDQIISGENPQRQIDSYSKVVVRANRPFVRDSETLLKIEELTVPPGNTLLPPFTFTVGPVVAVEKVQLLGAVNSTVSGISFGAWSISVTVSNPGEVPENVILEVTGQALGIVETSYIAADPEADFDKALLIDNDLIQGEEAAQTYAAALLPYATDRFPIFEFDIRGNPALELIDIIRIQDPADRIPDAKVIPVRITLEFDGGLFGRLTARKVG